jgi:hypothetical protein
LFEGGNAGGGIGNPEPGTPGAFGTAGDAPVDGAATGGGRDDQPCSRNAERTLGSGGSSEFRSLAPSSSASGSTSPMTVISSFGELAGWGTDNRRLEGGGGGREATRGLA